MTFDKQEHKDAVESLIRGASIPGNALEMVFELLRAVQAAKVEGQDNDA